MNMKWLSLFLYLGFGEDLFWDLGDFSILSVLHIRSEIDRVLDAWLEYESNVTQSGF